MRRPVKLDRRAVLKGLAGVALALPVLEAMGEEVAEQTPRRFCALYTANGMSLPNPKHGIDEWSWFPTKEGTDFEFGKSTEPLRAVPRAAQLPGRAASSERPEGRSAPLLRHVADRRAAAQSEAGHVQLRGARSGRRPAHQAVLPAAVAGAVDRRRRRASSRGPARSPTTSKASRSRPRTIRGGSSTGCFAATARRSPSQREQLQRRIKLVDAVLESARSLNQQLGQSDREKMDQYLTSLNEIESRLIASEKWIDIPLKKQDYSHLNLDATTEGEPANTTATCST